MHFTLMVAPDDRDRVVAFFFGAHCENTAAVELIHRHMTLPGS